jgi:hypothetical protein
MSRSSGGTVVAMKDKAEGKLVAAKSKAKGKTKKHS